jgi:hypothetical protein
VESVGERDARYRVNVDFVTIDADDRLLLEAFLEREGRGAP